MKKFITILLTMFSMAALAQTSPTPNALRLDQRNAANTAYISKFVPPAASVDCLVWMGGASAGAVPGCAALGPSFVNSGGTINVPVTVGPQGPIGPQGPQGVDGPVGADGATGPQGPAGPDGAQGPQGIEGPQGPQGPAGADGAPGATGPAGPTGAQGPVGAQGPAGATGATGATGANGAQGVQGPAGISDLGAPTSRSVALATAYQATTNTKAAFVTLTLNCDATLSLVGGTNCAGEVRIGNSNAVATGGGTAVATYRNQNTGALTVGLSLTQGIANTIPVFLPAGWYFAVRQTAGSGLSVATVVDQSTSP